jgi:chromatin segregation and condensation protein Rec8/ScpA/Scc1 (kleisin family)
MNPEDIKGNVFNLGVSSATIEDNLALLLYLIKEKKILPREVLL